jgi:phospholipid/cholesterol/gamma-HCH transport system permease protein
VNLLELVNSFILTVGEFTLFVISTLRSSVHMWRRRGLFLKQCEFIGVNSLWVTGVAAVFMGAVLGYELYVSFHIFGAEALLGSSVGISLFRELGPVMGSFMVTGRAGAAMAAEIASMRISEQIDALEVMAVDPIEYLVAPRVLAGVFMMPLLAVFFSVIGSFSAFVIACGVMDLDPAVFWDQYTKLVDPIELVHCTVKGAVFGLALTWIACFCGYRAQGGARSVGLATRSTVVSSFLAILLCDYILTSVLPYGFAVLKVL